MTEARVVDTVTEALGVTDGVAEAREPDELGEAVTELVADTVNLAIEALRETELEYDVDKVAEAKTVIEPETLREAEMVGGDADEDSVFETLRDAEPDGERDAVVETDGKALGGAELITEPDADADTEREASGEAVLDEETEAYCEGEPRFDGDPEDVADADLDTDADAAALPLTDFELVAEPEPETEANADRVTDAAAYNQNIRIFCSF